MRVRLQTRMIEPKLNDDSARRGAEWTAPARRGTELRRGPCASGFPGCVRLVLLFSLWVAASGPGRAAELRDQFAAREVLQSTNGFLTGSNTNATRETGEPQHADKPGGRSVWVSWIAPTNGIATFRTSGSTFDTLLAAYYFKRTNDTSLDELEEAAGNDDDVLAAPASSIRFGAEAGVRYEIAVDGYRGASGDIRIEWDFTPVSTVAPVVLNAPKDRALRLGDPLTLAVNIQSSPDMRLQWRFNGDSFGAEGPTLVIPSLQASNVGRYTLRIRIGDGDDEVRFETAPVEIQINSEGQTNALARDKILDAVDSPLTPDDDDLPGPGAPMFRAASANLAGAALGVTRGYNGTQIFNTTYATPDPNEPRHCGVTGGASYWFAYEAPTNGTLFLDTIGSRYDTVLAAYEMPPGGFSYQSLIGLGCDNDGVAPQGASRMQITVTAMKQYLVVVDGVGGVRGIAQLNYRLETATEPDLIPPTLSVTSPRPGNSVSTGPTMILAGTSSDNVAVSNILIQPASGQPITLTGTANWTTTLNLAAGTNVFNIIALDAAGNSSEPVGRSIYYRVTSPLTLEIQGNGTVSGAVNGQVLEIGRHYPLIAKPGAGYVFSGWSRATNATTANLRFAMQSNATLRANFIPNPFLPAAGSFNALILDRNLVARETTGWLRLTLRSSGAFSGSILQAHRRLSFAGQFDVSGAARVRVPRPGTNAIFLTLHLDLPEGQGMRGKLDFNSWPVYFVAWRAAFQARSNPATNFAGHYTMLVPGAADGGFAPIGDGVVALAVGASGRLTAAGVMADGTAFTQSVPLSFAGEWPLFAAMNRGRDLVAGALRARPPVDEGSDIEGTASWLRQPGSKPGFYTDGFLLESTVLGSIYTNPGPARLLGVDSAGFVLIDPILQGVATNSIHFGPGGRVTNGGPHRLTLSVSARTGVMRGLMVPGGTEKPVAWRGALLQRQQLGGGFYLRSNTVGRVLLNP